MNGEPPESAPWSRRRWITVTLVGLGLQLTVLHLFSPPGTFSTPPVAPGFKVHWLANPALARRTLDTLLLDDPTLLAMASPRGFSGAAWLRPKPEEFRTSEWTDAERSLAQPTQSLGGAFQLMAPTARPQDFEPVRRPAPTVPGTIVAPPVLRSASRLLVQGDLARRPLVKVPALRSWSHTDLLTDTRVQVIVSAEGLVISPRLAQATAARNPVQRAADQHAIELARGLRFASLPQAGSQGPGALAEGVLVFQWHTIEAPVSAKE
jgi:hypothetical protein